MAREYEWKRMEPPQDDPGWDFGFDWVYATTNSPDTPPEGEGWKRVYSFGFGSVSGSGGSPARQVRGDRAR